MTDELDQLRQLLGASEQTELEEVRHRIEDVEVRAQDVASVLGESIFIAQKNDEGLARALQKPVESCIQESVRRDTKLFADALFPVMGPAIRRSIVETLKGFVDSINRTIEQSVSMKGLGWRLEAMRSGVPFAEVVLKHTLVYRVEEVFLIHKETSLLIEHVAHNEVETQDSDAVSAMLSAIRDFVNDSFSRSTDHGQGELGRVDMGERVLWIVHGPYATLAAVVRGVPPIEYQDFLHSTVENLHSAYGQALEEFEGDEGSVPGATAALEECLWDAYQEGDQKKVGFFSPAVIGIILVVLGLIGWFGWSSYQKGLYEQALVQTLEQEEGLVLISWRETDEGYYLHGLLDPLAQQPTKVLEAAGLTTEGLSSHWRPYQSLDRSIVIKRAKVVLEPPQGVELSLVGDILQVKGQATQDWRDRAGILANALPGVGRIDLSGVYLNPDDTLRRAMAALQPPDTVNMAVEENRLILRGVAEEDWIQFAEREWRSVSGVSQFDADALMEWDEYLLAEARRRLAPGSGVAMRVTDKRLFVSGMAPLAWKRTLAQRAADIQGLDGVDAGSLKIAEYAEARRIAAQLDGQSLAFVNDTELDPAAERALQTLRDRILRLQAIGKQAGFKFAVQITGYTDAMGTLVFNRKLSVERANFVVAWLIKQGVAPGMLRAEGHAMPLPGLENRRVLINVVLPELQD